MGMIQKNINEVRKTAMKVRMLAIHYIRPENKGKYLLDRIDYGIKRVSKQDTYIIQTLSQRLSIKTNFEESPQLFEQVKIIVNNTLHAIIDHSRFIFYPDTQYYSVRALIPLFNSIF